MMDIKIFLFFFLVFIPQTLWAETLKENYFKVRGHLEMMTCENLTLSDKSYCLAAHSGYKQYLTFYNMGSYANANHFYETMHKKFAINLIGEEEKATFDIDHIKIEDIKAILASPDPRNEKQQLLLGHTLSSEERKHEILHLVELFLQQGGDPNSVVDKTSGATLLTKATSVNNLNLVKLLISQGADVNKTLINGASPLHISSIRSAKIAKILLAKGANPNAQDKLGDTPLHDVIYKWLKYGGGKGIYIEDLVKAGGSLYVSNNLGETPADLAKRLMREAYNKKQFIAKQEEQKKQRRKMAEAEKEKNSFNFLKAITMTVGFVAGNGLKLEPEEQIRVLSGIIQDSQSDIEGSSNTMSALNNAKQKQRYQSDITIKEDSNKNTPLSTTGSVSCKKWLSTLDKHPPSCNEKSGNGDAFAGNYYCRSTLNLVSKVHFDLRDTACVNSCSKQAEKILNDLDCTWKSKGNSCNGQENCVIRN